MAKCPECQGEVIAGPYSQRRKGMFSCESCGAWLMPTIGSGLILIGGIILWPVALIIFQHSPAVREGVFTKIKSSGREVITPLGVLIVIAWTALWITIWWNKMAKFVAYNKTG
jgi:ribosomal protein S27E